LLVTAAPSLSTVWWASIAVIAFVVAIDSLSRPPGGAVQFERIALSDYRVGRESTYILRLKNRSARRLQIEIREVLPASFKPNQFEARLTLAPGAREEIPVMFLPLERGAFDLTEVTLRLSAPRGLLAWQEAPSRRDELLILPGRPKAETRLLLTRTAVLQEPGRQLLRRRGQDREFESLRDYVVGDDLRSVDWKASARRQRPQVRQFQTERNSEILLAVDCGRLMGNLVHGVTKLDLAIVPVLDLAAVAVQNGERVGLLTFDSEVLGFVPPRGGLRQLGNLTDHLAQLETSFRQTNYSRAIQHLEAHHKKRAVIVIFTDFTDEYSSRELQAVLAALARRHVILFVAVGDQHLEEVLAEEPRQIAAVYQKAAAAELLGERRRVVESLQRMGVLAVDADPLHLSAPLIGRYLEARAQL